MKVIIWQDLFILHIYRGKIDGLNQEAPRPPALQGPTKRLADVLPFFQDRVEAPFHVGNAIYL